jgi:DNA-binding response OmpR family regulator
VTSHLPTATVLVIEDDPASLELVANRLEAAGYTMTLTQTARAGMEEAQHGAFNAILLDLGLPDGDGMDVLGWLRVRRPDVPVLIMSAHGSDMIAAQALAEGAACYLVKPFGRRELMEALQRVIGR